MRALILLVATLLIAGCGQAYSTTVVITAGPASTVRPVATPQATPEEESTQDPTEEPDRTEEPDPTEEPEDEPDALEMMEVAFIGTPSQDEIRDLMEEAFEIYAVEWTEENLSRAASSLVALRQEAEAAGNNQVTEMAILEAMVADGGLPGMSFPEAAGWMSAVLRLE